MAFIISTGPIGWVIGAGACIAVALGDYFLGDKIASFIFKEDPNEVERLRRIKIDKIKKEVLTSAYALLDLTEHCTERELKEARRVALLKYHTDKSGGGEEEKKKNQQIIQAIVAAYVLIQSHMHKIF